jgi:hypothetical protein
MKVTDMRMRLDLGAAALALFLFSASAQAGLIYSGPRETTHAIDPAIGASDARFVEWANRIDESRTAFAPRGSTSVNQAGGFNSLGDLNTAEITAGVKPGYLTVTFPRGIRNGAGHDFAVFENGFVFPAEPNILAELAYVEVSTDGLSFAQFPSISTNTAWAGTFGQAFGGFDATKIHNLAGKHAGGFGTPFELDDLADDPLVTGGLVDLANIQFLRLVDIPGNGAFLDSQGNPILDAWLTSGTGGYDFRLGTGSGVGVINAVPEPAAIVSLAIGAMALAVRKWRTARSNRVRT